MNLLKFGTLPDVDERTRNGNCGSLMDNPTDQSAYDGGHIIATINGGSSLPWLIN